MDKELFSKNHEFLPSYSDRPIVLSPPPVEHHGNGSVKLEQDSSAQSLLQPQLPKDYLAQRQQLVGYNLQQEFEALKADLDLDLSMSNTVEENEGTPTASGGAGSSNESGNGTGAAGTPSSLGGRFLSPNFSHGLGSSLLENFTNLSSSNVPMGHLGNSMAPGAGAGAGSHHLLGLLSSKSLSFLPPSLLVPSRPQSVNDFSNLLGRNQNINAASGLSRLQASGLSFYNDLIRFTSWMENLDPQDIVAMLDHWCNNLPFDILLTMKSRLETHLNHMPDQGHTLMPSKMNYGYEDLVTNMENTSLDSYPRHQATQQNGLAQPKPKNNDAFRNHLFQESKFPRPRLADPSLNNRFQGSNAHMASANNQASGQSNNSSYQLGNPLDRARSPTSHLHEKTNFLQLAAASNSPLSYAQHGSNPEDGYDLNAALKLGALATINSRVALDSNKKGPAFQQHQTLQLQQPHSHNPLAFEESINRQGNSSSVPAQPQKYSVAAMSGSSQGPSAAVLKMKKDDGMGRSKQSTPVGGVSSNSANSLSSMPTEIATLDLLNNIPAWLKLLRLHKYTDCLKDMYWKDLVELSDEDLENKGVKALGARRKLLKAFDAVKQSRL